ncbi:MAG: sugar ABC transporter permease [Ruminiclostridium sp.]|nr:sugar ABC transporter permease [Ruminiclostridium sp.]
MMTTGKKNLKLILIYMLPAVVIYSFFSVIPIALAVIYSFFEWTGGRTSGFIWFQNYGELLFNPDFWNAFKNNVIFVIGSCIGQIGIGFIFSLFLISRDFKLKKLFQGALFIPCLMAPLVVGFIWIQVYNSRFGLLYMIFNSLGIDFMLQDWLGNPKIVIYSLLIPHIWQWIGFYVIVFLAAFQALPESVLEVAEIDGATGFKKTKYIIIPLLRDTIKVSLILCISGTMKVFDHIFIMTGGGPGRASEVLSLYVYNNTFTNFRFGYGSAGSVTILIISLGIIYIVKILLTGKEYNV